MAKNSFNYVRNASSIRLKIMGMELNEEMLISSSSLPASYKSPVKFIASIIAKYDCAYSVEKMKESGLYKITCIKELLEIKNPVTLQKPKAKETPQLKQEHPFSFGELAQLIDEKLNFAERDVLVLDPIGVTMLRINNLRTQNSQLKDTMEDSFFVAEIGARVLEKNAMRTTLFKALNNIRRMAKNALNDITYATFRFEGLQALSDSDFATRARQIHRRAGRAEINVLLLPEGCTVAFMNGFAANLVQFISLIDEVEDAENDRLMGTYNRTLLGNTLYKEIVKICNTGKDAFENISYNPARWEDYLLGK